MNTQTTGQSHSFDPSTNASVVGSNLSQTHGQSQSIRQSMVNPAQPLKDDKQALPPNNNHIVKIKYQEELKMMSSGLKL